MSKFPAPHQSGYDSSHADSVTFFYVRLGLWMTLLVIPALLYLNRYIEPEVAERFSKIEMHVAIPGMLLAVAVSHLGKKQHLLYGNYIAYLVLLATWILCVDVLSTLHSSLNYYIFLPIIALLMIQSVIIITFFPKQMLMASVVFFGLVFSYPLLTDPSAHDQFPAFIVFSVMLIATSTFLFAIHNIQVAWYFTLAESQKHQSDLLQARSLLDVALENAPVWMLCFDEKGALVLDQGIPENFIAKDKIKTAAAFEAFLEVDLGVNTKLLSSSPAQVEIGNTPLMITHSTEKNLVIFSFVDMTERVGWEKAFQMSQKLRLVGEMTSGIAHDYNNILAIAMSSLEAIPKTGNEELWRNHLALAFNALDQARSVSQKLLVLAGKRVFNLKKIDVSQLISDMHPIFKSALGDGIELTMHCNVHAPIIADSSEFERAILNLVINARQVLEDGRGKIQISTELKDDIVFIRVQDNGAGIADSIQSKIFEPFFTTKKAGSGSGLGLSVVKSYVEQSKGQIFLTSKPGQTIFEICLPVEKEIPLENALQPHVANTPKMQKRCEKILLVDDNLLLLQSTSALFEINNVDCLTASDREKALAIMSKHKDIDAAFIDLSMPDISGIALGQELMQLDGKCRFYLLTGEASTKYVDSAKQVGFRQVFLKPLKFNELMEAATW